MTFKYSERIDQTSHIYRTVAKPLLQLGTDQEVTTLSELFLTSCDRYKSRICLGSRELIGTIRDSQGRTKLIQGNYQWLTYNQAYLEAADFALGLKATCEVNPGDRVAIYAETKREWLLACQGCFLQNLTVVTCYASLGEEALLHCLQETEVRVVMADSRLVRRLLPLTPKLPHLKYVILLDGSSTEEFCVGKISLIEYNDVLNNALQRPRVYQVPTPTDTAFIMYTSGSTGIPKGVMISHANVMSALWGIQDRMNVTESDVYLGYLPLAHILELIAEHLHLMVGASIGYGSPHTLTDKSVKTNPGTSGDATELRPTLMAAVPAVLDKIRDSITGHMDRSNWLVKWLFNHSFRAKQHVLNYAEGNFDISWYQRIFLNRIKYSLGGQVRAMISGGAPLSRETQEFMRICFDVPILQGYGLTETCAAGTITYLHETGYGRVGGPLSCNYIRLVDWEEGGYLCSDENNGKINKPRGEVYLGGDNITMGYFNNEEKTEEDYSETEDPTTGKKIRWFHTGDIGQIHPDGSLEIIDRRKDLVKLSCGEYVSLGKVESKLKLSPYIDNVMVFAPVLPVQTSTVAVIQVTDAEGKRTPLQDYATKHNIQSNDLEALCQLPEIRKLVNDDVLKQCQYAWLKPFETPSRIHLTSTEWTADNGLVTAALKLRRENLKTHYATELSEMYQTS